MSQDEVMCGVVIDAETLTLEQFARACAVQIDWVVARVQAGLLVCRGDETNEMRFASVELTRGRRLAALERDFDAAPELAALAVDLMEEVERLRRQLALAGIAPGPT